MPETEGLSRQLLSASAVRERAHAMRRLAAEDRLAHWRIDETRMDAAADYVLDTIRSAYPDLDIPFHARWRHFVIDGRDRWAEFAAGVAFDSSDARARSEFDLAIVSVLLDAGAGMVWRYRTADGKVLSRSEGLAIACLDMFAGGLFSARPGEPLRADAERLAAITPGDLAAGFQVGPDNPLEGVAGRAALLNALGRVVGANRLVFAIGDAPRPGGLYDHLSRQARDGRLPAEAILAAILESFGRIWPSRLSLNGRPLGDAWRHPALATRDATSGLVPFHKLSQWLAYSLIEPLQRAGIAVVDVDGLTGLAEYRNGGLFVDLGVLRLKNPDEAKTPHAVSSPLIVEWRALTVALLDELADLLRRRLNMDRASLPLARILQGGTWSAGRRIAGEKRPEDGRPPIVTVSDGTVF